jgi:hypothetical protein
MKRGRESARSRRAVVCRLGVDHFLAAFAAVHFVLTAEEQAAERPRGM